MVEIYSFGFCLNVGLFLCFYFLFILFIGDKRGSSVALVFMHFFVMFLSVFMFYLFDKLFDFLIIIVLTLMFCHIFDHFPSLFSHFFCQFKNPFLITTIRPSITRRLTIFLIDNPIIMFFKRLNLHSQTFNRLIFPSYQLL